MLLTRQANLLFQPDLIQLVAVAVLNIIPDCHHLEMPISDVGPSLASSLAPLDAAFLLGTGSDPGFRNIARVHI